MSERPSLRWPAAQRRDRQIPSPTDAARHAAPILPRVFRHHEPLLLVLTLASCLPIPRMYMRA